MNEVIKATTKPLYSH